jgi:PAS domain-containing protein
MTRFEWTGTSSHWTRETLLASVVAEDRDGVSRSLSAAMETGILRFEAHIRRADGNLRSIVVEGRVYHNADGLPIRIAGVATDATERRRIEEILQQSQTARGCRPSARLPVASLTISTIC